MYKWFKKKRRPGMLTLSLSETCVRENPDDFLEKVILEFFINCLVLHFLKACEIEIVTISAPRAQLPAGKSSIGKSTAETRQVKRQPRSVSMLTPRSRQGFPPAPFFLTKRLIQKWPKNWVYLQFGPKFPYWLEGEVAHAGKILKKLVLGWDLGGCLFWLE